MFILDVGCGNQKRPGAIGIDSNPATQADVIHNLDQYPYPFKDNYFDEIYVTHCIEHLDDVVKVMEELHRIGKPGCRVTIDAPYFSGQDAFSDPTHKHFFTSRTFDYFTGENSLDFYTKARFKKVRADLMFYPKFKNKMIWRIAKMWPLFYEEHLTWIFPAWFMSFDLEVIK